MHTSTYLIRVALENKDCMAEREGFEPSIAFRLYTLSKRAPSATRPSLRSEDAQWRVLSF